MKLNPFIIKALPCFYFIKLCTWGWLARERERWKKSVGKWKMEREFSTEKANDNSAYEHTKTNPVTFAHKNDIRKNFIFLITSG